MNWKKWSTWIVVLFMAIGISGAGGIVSGMWPRILVGALSGVMAGLIWKAGSRISDVSARRRQDSEQQGGGYSPPAARPSKPTP